MTVPPLDAPLFRERLSVPPSYWVIGMFFALSFVAAVGLFLGPAVASAAFVATACGVAFALLWFGRTIVAVDEEGLRVGSAQLEWPYLGAVQRLDVDATRARVGVGADARAYVVQRPFVPTAVEIAVQDRADPHPYWLVSSRHPAELALALEQGRARYAAEGEDPA